MDKVINKRVKKALYQDGYNPKKTWLVCYMKGAMYLKQFKQFIDGTQYGKGIRCTIGMKDSPPSAPKHK